MNARKRKHTFRQCCADIVKHVKVSLEEEKKQSRQKIGTTKVHDRLVFYTGLSSSTLNKLLTSQKLPKPGVKLTRDKGYKISRDDEAKIRPALISLVQDKVTPNLDNLLQRLKAREGGWEFSRSTLYTALLRIGFKFNSKRSNYYDRLREDEANIVLRNTYLRYYMEYVNDGRPIVFMDESWINKNDRPKRAWHDGTKETVDAVPPGKGARWILIGAGTKDGWIPNSAPNSEPN